jgi:hypothetical protein
MRGKKASGPLLLLPPSLFPLPPFFAPLPPSTITGCFVGNEPLDDSGYCFLLIIVLHVHETYIWELGWFRNKKMWTLCETVLRYIS